MIEKVRLFTPSPTPLLPAAQFAMDVADVHHHTAEFGARYLQIGSWVQQGPASTATPKE